MNHDDKIISIKVIIIIVAFQKKMTQFSKSNLLILSSQFPSFFFIQENDTFDQTKRSFFIRSNIIVAMIFQGAIGQNGFVGSANRRQWTRSTFISKLHGEEQAEPRDRAGQKQVGCAATALMRSCIVHAEATYFTRVCSQQDRWTLSANKLKCIACELLIHFTNN